MSVTSWRKSFSSRKWKKEEFSSGCGPMDATGRCPNSSRRTEFLRVVNYIGTDGKVVGESLFSPVYQDDFNDYEAKGGLLSRWSAGNYLVAPEHCQAPLLIQGWRKHKVYPDFILAMTADGEKQRLLIVETKGDHLENPDSHYKQKLLNLCSMYLRGKMSPRSENWSWSMIRIPR